MVTIKSSREIDAVFRTGQRLSTPCCLVLVAGTPEGRSREGRLAFVAGRKIGGAVTRNRAKRVLREAARRLGAPWRGWDVVMVANSRTPVAAPAEIDGGLADALSRAGVIS